MRDNQTPSDSTDTPKLAVTVEATTPPTYEFIYEVGDTESLEDAAERAEEIALNEANVALADLAHEIEFEVTDTAVHE